MTFWPTPQGVGVLLIVLATRCFAALDSTIKYTASLAPVMMVLRIPVQKLHLLRTPNPRCQALRGVCG